MEEDGGLNLYEFAANDTINDIDADGRITITEGPAHLRTDTCGGYYVEFTWTLDNPQVPTGFKPPIGFYVQKVTITYNIKDCKGNPINMPKEVFWEMAQWDGNAISQKDISSNPSRPNTQGAMAAEGEIKYFSKLTTGDLSKNPNWKPAGNGRGPNTETEPKWWAYPSANGEKTARRVASSSWYCCCGGPHFSQAHADP